MSEINLDDFEFSSAITLAPKMKATVHKNGSLGFNSDAIKGLGIKIGMGIRIGKSKTNPDPMTLLMKISENPEADDFKVNKAGNYYYIRTKPYFDAIELPYNDGRVIYDLRVKADDKGVMIAEMKGRKKKKKD
jgi:hypothetical protein